MTQGYHRFRTYRADRDVPNGWLELQFYQTKPIMLLALTVLSFGIMAILAGIGVATFTNPVARQRAKMILAAAGVYLVLVIALVAGLALSDDGGLARPPRANVSAGR